MASPPVSPAVRLRSTAISRAITAGFARGSVALFKKNSDAHHVPPPRTLCTTAAPRVAAPARHAAARPSRRASQSPPHPRAVDLCRAAGHRSARRRPSCPHPTLRPRAVVLQVVAAVPCTAAPRPLSPGMGGAAGEHSYRFIFNAGSKPIFSAGFGCGR